MSDKNKSSDSQLIIRRKITKEGLERVKAYK